MSTKRKTSFSNKKFNDPTIYENNAQLVKMKLRFGADPNYISENDNLNKKPAISFAIYKNYDQVLQIVEAFIKDPRTDLNAENSYKSTPLMYASDSFVSDEIGSKIVALLLKQPQVKINAKDYAIRTAIYFACLHNRIRCVKLLTQDSRVNVNIAINIGETPLYAAIEKGHIECVRLLVSCKSLNPNVLTKKQTPLYKAINDDKAACVKALVSSPSLDPNISTNDETPLYKAVDKGNIECIRALLSLPNLDPNILSKGETPLHLAHKKNKKLIVIELLKDGKTDPTKADKNGNIVLTQIKDIEILEHIPFD